MTVRSGLSLVELLIALALTALIVSQTTILLDAANQSNELQTVQADLESRGRLAIDRIALALMGADLASITPEPIHPLHTSEIAFGRWLGTQDGVEITSDQERIRMSEDGGSVIWSQESRIRREVVWCNVVTRYLDGEQPNDADDNGNQLVDEAGLTFYIEGRRVLVELSVGSVTRSGSRHTKKFMTEVTCRN